MIFQIVSMWIYFASISSSSAAHFSKSSNRVGFSLRGIFAPKHFSIFKSKNNKKKIFINDDENIDEKKVSTTISNKFILNTQKFISVDATPPSEATLIVHDVSNMLSIMKKQHNTAKFDLNMENNILKIIEKKINVKNLKKTIKQRVVVGSTISNTTSKGFIFQNKIFTPPGIQNPFWGIRIASAAAAAASLTHIYPNLVNNHVYLEYKKTILCKEEKVDYYGAKMGKENLHLVNTLILLSGDGNAKEKYGFRHLCMDAIAQNKKVIVFGLNTSKFYKQLAKQNKIILIDGDTEDDDEIKI